MRVKCRPKSWIFIVYDPILLACRFDDPVQFRIMDMAYFREKVMLYLEIKPAQQPCQECTVCCKVRSRLELVHHPFVLHPVVFNGLEIGN